VTAPVVDQRPLASTTYGGQGPRVVLLHGLFGQGRNFTGVAKALSDEARVTLVDLPDHGRSPWSDEFSYLAVADRVAGLLDVAAPGERWTVVGHSMGGKVAMLVALRHPDLVERLCVVDVAPATSAAVSSFGGRRPTPWWRPACPTGPSAASSCRTCAATAAASRPAGTGR
jgi:esterase